VREDLHRARHRLGKFLLRRGRYYGLTKHRWGTRHMAWLRQQRFEAAAAQATLDSYLLSIEQLEERLHALEAKRAEYAGLEPYREAVGALRCFRGIDTVSAIGLIAELHTFGRFDSPRRLMA
jgi:transposase